jgi:hypothetical protein
MTELPPTHPAAALFPMLDETELAELAEDIRVRGLTHPVWFYEDPVDGAVLLDGRNRWLACRCVGVEPDIRWYRGDDPIGFSISENVARRHLTTGQKAAVAYKSLPLYEAEAAKRKRLSPGRPRKEEDEKLGADLPQVFDQQEQDPAETQECPACHVVWGPDRFAVSGLCDECDRNRAEDSGECEPATSIRPTRAPRARDRAAQAAGTSGRAAAQYKRVVEQAPDLAKKVDAGMALDRAERIIRDREAEQRRVEQARREANAQPEPYTIDIRHGDFREVLADIDDGSVHAIITDPPYPFEYLPLLADLAAWADKVLTPDGVLAVLIGQTHLPEVYRLLDGHRPYRWTGCYLTEGPGYVSHARKVQSSWKPLLVYGRGPRFGDVIRSEGSNADAKSNHKWGQDYAAFHTIIERLTQRGQTVADPFMGAGTTVLAAHALGRHAIGCDIDATAVQRSRERVGNG